MTRVPVAVARNLNSAAASRRLADRWWVATLAATLSLVGGWAALPPVNVSEAGYAALVPLLLWVCGRPRTKAFCWTVGIYSWVYWVGVLIWLRHIHIVAPVLLAVALGAFVFMWFTAVRRWWPDLIDSGRVSARIVVVLGLAGLWVVFEWTRTWLFTGFPWAPMALSQWQRPAVLQPAAWVGAYGVSFMLIAFNLGLTAYLFRLFRPVRQAAASLDQPVWWRRLPVEFYLALSLLLGSILLFFHEVNKAGAPQSILRAGIVQPYIPAKLKWDEDIFRENLQVLRNLTLPLAAMNVDLVLWPEAATPAAIIDSRNDRMRMWVENLCREVDAPILQGNLAEIKPPDGFVNGIFLVTPEDGLQPDFYAKQKLVPFGEYVPLRFLPFVDKVVPFDYDFMPGSEATVIPLPINNRIWQVGSLVCYEDIFPRLGRDMVLAGADFIVVVTNDAWYGEEGGAWQHAAHSVLRAVETRRPIVRCGNNGWSGWIDELGRTRDVLLDDRNSIYFRGSGTINLSRGSGWAGYLSPYVRFGDWFIALCLLLTLAAARIGFGNKAGQYVA